MWFIFVVIGAIKHIAMKIICPMRGGMVATRYLPNMVRFFVVPAKSN